MQLSLHDLLRLHGAGSSAVMLMVLAMLCAIPAAGLGTVLSLGIVLLAWRWPLPPGGDGAWSGRLRARLDVWRLDETWSRRCLRALAWVYAVASRLLRERAGWVWRGPATRGWAVWIGLMGVLILLPIPLGNLLPSLSLVLLSLGWMFRDGVVMLLAALAGAAALVFAWATAGWLVTAGQALLSAMR